MDSYDDAEYQISRWESHFLETFRDLRNFTFADDCGILEFTQKMQEIQECHSGLREVWKSKLEFRARYTFLKSTQLSANKMQDDDIDIPTPDFVMKFIDDVGKILTLLLLSNEYPQSPVFVPEPKDQIKEVVKELKLLRFFVLFIAKKCIEPQTRNIFFTHVLIVAIHVAMVAWLYLPIQGKHSQGLDPSEMNFQLADLLQTKNKSIQPSIPKVYIDVLQALKSKVQSKNEHNLAELPTVSNQFQIVGSNDQMSILQDLRNLLRDNIIHCPVLDLEFPCQDMDTLIVDAGLLVYSLYDIKGKKEDPALLEDVNRALGLDLPSDIQPVEEITSLIIRKSFQSYFPRIHGLGYVDLLLNNLKEFQGRYSDSLAPIMNHLQIIQKELQSSQPFSQGSYEVDYVIDTCIRKEAPQWWLKRWLSVIIEEITLIRAEVEIKERKVLNLVPHDTMDTASAQMSSQLSKTLRNEEIVGFEDVRKELREKLIKGCRELNVISIVGMPGLGKTTLAYKLYSDESVISHFDIRAQCCVSQVYQRMDLLLTLLHAVGESEKFSKEADAAEKLRQTLLVKRYLILVDDVWEASAWDDISSCFYDAKNGSRIILTTRHLEVSEYAKSVSEPISLRTLNVDESWKLLEDKVFGKESFSHPLEEVGKYIAEKCGGLPLSIVLVAGILAKMERTEESWKQAVVKQSYQVLPYHLKTCFLYLGAFLEDRVIDVSRLTRLWISESFVKSYEGKSVEDIAEGYLENLIARNLLMVSKRSYLDGKVQKCRLHDLLLEFCKKKATEENFLQMIKWDSNTDPSCIYAGKQRCHPSRLAFCEMDTLVNWRSSCSFVGSVLVQQDTKLTGIATSSFLWNFKFLRVLDLEKEVCIYSIPVDLIHLRYFSARIYHGSDIPSSISNLWNLESLVLKAGYAAKTVPATVYKMVRLRHLHISSCRLLPIENAKELYEDSPKLHNLRTISIPRFSCIEDLELMLTKTPNLRELDCVLDEEIQRSQSHLLVFPEQLEKLNISGDYEMIPRIRVRISASNLKTLRLHSFELDVEDISHIGHELQNLQALVMRRVKFRQRKWEVSDDEFPQLKVLELEDWNGAFWEWTFSDNAFPNLEFLIIVDMSSLREIPSCFADISTLKYMQLKRCTPSIVKSARDIRETKVEDYQNADFQLIVTPHL
ncbi:unnamed protein product [Withania somnifera]